MSLHELILPKQNLGLYIMTLCLNISLGSLELRSHLGKLFYILIIIKLLNIKNCRIKKIIMVPNTEEDHNKYLLNE